MGESTKTVKELGELLAKYVDKQATFAEVELFLAEVPGSDEVQSELFLDIYHVLNHYDLDKGLRDKDPKYAEQTNRRVHNIAESLKSGSIPEITQAIDSFWNWSKGGGKT